MTDELRTVQFRLLGILPKAMPMDRLAKYVFALAKLASKPANIHLTKIKQGSLVLEMSLPIAEHQATVRRITHARSQGAAEPAVVRAICELEELVVEDKLPSATFKNGNAVILRLHGYTKVDGPKLGPISQRHTIRGRVVGLEGRDKTKHARIVESGSNREFSAEIKDATLAIRLKEFLWMDDALELAGDSRWVRHPDGRWEMKSFKVDSITELDQRSLTDALKLLGEIHKDSEWPEVVDPIDQLRKMRG